MSPSSDIELMGGLRLAPGVTVERMGEEFLALVGQQVVRVSGPSAVVLAAVQQQAGLPRVALPSGVVAGAGEVAPAVDVLVELGVIERTAVPDAAAHSARGAEPVSVSRRRALRMVGTAAALGVTVLVLPHAAAASSGSGGGENGGGGGDGGGGPVTPFVTAEPIGYEGSGTGAIRVAWSPVAGAAGYEVGWSTDPTDPVASYIYIPRPGGTTSYDLTGLVGTDTTHHIVVRATVDGVTSYIEEVSSSSVIATGGAITLLPAVGTPTHVVHTFTTDGTFKLNRDIDVRHLVVGGGGGGGGCTGRGFCAGGGGGGGVSAGSGTRTVGSLTIVVGAGGRGGPDVNEAPADGYALGGEDSRFGEVVALGGGAGGSAPAGIGDANSVPSALPTPWEESEELKATGGGGVGQFTRQLGATGSSTRGGDGTASGTVPDQSGGGGGGAGGNGAVGSSTTGGNGGAGVASDISGTNVEYGSGGGGGKRRSGSGGPGGLIIGTAGLVTAGGSGGRDAAGSPGEAGRGGGGGGAGRDTGDLPKTPNAVGGAGGSGVVIVRYALPS